MNKSYRELKQSKLPEPHEPTPQELLKPQQITITNDNTSLCKHLNGLTGIYVVYFRGKPMYVGASKKSLGVRVTPIFSGKHKPLQRFLVKHEVEVGVEIIEDEWDISERERELVWELKPSLNQIIFKHPPSLMLKVYQ